MSKPFAPTRSRWMKVGLVIVVAGGLLVALGLYRMVSETFVRSEAIAVEATIVDRWKETRRTEGRRTRVRPGGASYNAAVMYEFELADVLADQTVDELLKRRKYYDRERLMSDAEIADWQTQTGYETESGTELVIAGLSVPKELYDGLERGYTGQLYITPDYPWGPQLHPGQRRDVPVYIFLVGLFTVLLGQTLRDVFDPAASWDDVRANMTGLVGN